MATYQDLNLIPPAMAFVLHRYPNYPYPVSAPYYTPEQFRSLLRQTRFPPANAGQGDRPREFEQALAQFPSDGMESEYEPSDSLRWRAWYDLTRGRLLAMSVRQLEYVLACEKVFQYNYLKPETNHIVLKPSQHYLAGSMIEPRHARPSGCSPAARRKTSAPPGPCSPNGNWLTSWASRSSKSWCRCLCPRALLRRRTRRSSFRIFRLEAGGIQSPRGLVVKPRLACAARRLIVVLGSSLASFWSSAFRHGRAQERSMYVRVSRLVRMRGKWPLGQATNNDGITTSGTPHT